MTKALTFHLKINGGEVKTLSIPSGIYQVAAAAALSLVTEEEAHNRIVIEIWVPELLPDYGPYFFEIDQDEYLNLVVRHMVVLKRAS